MSGADAVKQLLAAVERQDVVDVAFAAQALGFPVFEFVQDARRRGLAQQGRVLVERRRNATGRAAVNQNELVAFHAWPRAVVSALTALQVRTWGDLSRVSVLDLLSFKGFGKTNLNVVRTKLAARGLALADHGPRRIPIDAQLPATEPVCGVYFLRCREFVKIGQAQDIKKRCCDLGQATPFDVELVAFIRCADQRESRRVERQLHLQFVAHRQRLEWFRLEGAVAEFVAALQVGSPT